MVGNEENILVEFDYQNIVLVDPNKTISDEGVVKERMLKQENLVYYANLEATMIPRTRFAVGTNGNYNAETISIATMNFMKPGGKEFLSNEYLDEITGLNSVGGNGTNQIIETKESITKSDKSTEYYTSQNVKNNIDTQLLGITSINVDTNLAGFPEVTVEMEDIRGRALFEKGENSPYAVFFNYPYPLFFLTIKGYLGKAVKYQLALRTFNARFDTASGNFKITVKFFAYKYNVLTNLTMKYLYSLPFMYMKTYKLTPTNDAKQQSSQNTNGNGLGNTATIPSSRGIQKIKEVYSEYKSKGLISEDFPEITIQELVGRLSNLEKLVEDSFSPADLTPLTDADNFRQIIRELQGDVLTYKGESWFDRYMDSESFFIEKKTGKKNKVYTFKKEILQGTDNRQVGTFELKKIVDTAVKNLKENKTFGTGKYPININLSINTFTFQPSLTLDDIDLDATFSARYNKQGGDNSEDFKNFKSGIQPLLNSLKPTQNGKLEGYWFYFEGEKSFEKEIEVIENQLNSHLKTIEEDLTKKLSERLNDKEKGLGFKPTLRNVIAVILASSEGFLRMMCEVHQLAWDVREDKDRRNAILDGDKTNLSTETKENTQITSKSLIPVYPWPQFFVETNTENGEKFELAYPGDPKHASKTKSYLWDKWPEVEFVEEFLKGRAMVLQGSIPTLGATNSANYINRISLASVDFPTSNVFYSNRQESKFMYEIYERILLYSFYQRFASTETLKEISELISECEFNNIFNALSNDSPNLLFKIKNYALNSTNFVGHLAAISNSGLGESWQKYIRDIFVTDYIQNEVEKSFGIYPINLFNPGTNIVNPQPEQLKKLEEFLSSQRSNKTNLLDTFPYNVPNWYKTNLANGNSASQNDILNTSKVLEINIDKKMIANFTNNTKITEKRPVTNFNFYNPTYPTPILADIKNFYKNRIENEGIKTQQITEGGIFYKNYSGNNTDIQTTSIMNTPYFVNSILEGVQKSLNNDPYPYVVPAYLFINSLPLSTLKEKYKSFDGTTTTDLDYIFTCFKKFGALHRVPYAWILKYGSIWYRYKKWKETNVDILDNSWKNFDVINGFDPKTSDVNKQYNITLDGVLQEIKIQKTTTILGDTTLELNIGFYPKVINDFNIFCKGYDLFETYSNDEIQNKINLSSGYTLTFNDPGSFSKDKGYNRDDRKESLRVRSWATTLLDDDDEYVLPSFGSTINQSQADCFDKNGKMKIKVASNPAITNGAIKSFWALPNYGYFDNNELDKPKPDTYLKSIFNNESQQESFSIGQTIDYETIDEMFSVFNKEALDILEQEFLNFSRSIYSYQTQNVINEEGSDIIYRTQIETIPSETETQYRNFQYLLRNLLKVSKSSEQTAQTRIEDIQKKQFDNIVNNLRSFMEYDVVIKYGNPGNYNRRLFDSYSSVNFIEDRIVYNPYILNSLPTKGGSTTLTQSRNSNPDAWKALETYVGFSPIKDISYSSTGSTITDFFVDMNIEFLESSVIELAPLIKIYGTQKKIDPTLNRTKFISLLDQYITTLNTQTNTTLDLLFQKLQKKLPNVDVVPEKKQTPVIQGEQTPLEMWESFKGLNDTWIAGYDYTRTTFLEDVLLLDRASRNISDQIYIDPFKVRNLLSNINESASVYYYIESLLTIHNFVCMMHPAYINYYNVQEVQKNNIPKIEGTLEFGNNLFGTFLNVDTRSSSPKLVCTYAAEPSSLLNMDKNENVRFKSDSFELSRSSGMPLLDKLEGKTDWGLSNKVVGFNVDIGLRNQNIFYHFDVSQDLGKQTVESLTQMDNTINQANGRNTYTQNVSLWNFYKKRSYQCKVQCLGNAMIQPTMYFNLRYVPMFYGPYYIMDVKHSITPGKFETTFTGIRQQIFALPKLDSYIQTLTKNLYSQVVERLKQKINTEGSSGQGQNNTNLNPTNARNVTLPSNCSSNLSENFKRKYRDNTAADQTLVRKNVKEVSDLLKQYITGTANDSLTRLISFVTIYLDSYNGTDFIGWNNNLAGVRLLKDSNLNSEYSPSLLNLVTNKYLCQDLGNGYSEPFATFESEDKFYTFLKNRWQGISSVLDDTPETILKFWFNNWNANRGTTNQFEIWRTNNITDYDNYLNQVKKAISLAKTPEVGL